MSFCELINILVLSIPVYTWVLRSGFLVPQVPQGISERGLRVSLIYQDIFCGVRQTADTELIV